MDPTSSPSDDGPTLGPLTEADDLPPPSRPRPPRDWFWLRVSLGVLVLGTHPVILLPVERILVVRQMQDWVATHEAEWRAGTAIPDFRWIRPDAGWVFPVVVASLVLVATALAALLVLFVRVCVRQNPLAWIRLVVSTLALVTVPQAYLWSWSNVPAETPGEWPTLTYEVNELLHIVVALAVVAIAVLWVIGPVARRPLPRWRPAPGWLPDPREAAALRWWDGERWTDQVR